MAEVVWTEEAAAWLREIQDYIAQDDELAAERTVQGICDQAQMLLRFPQIGHLHRTPAGREVRILLYGHYRIAYLLGEENEVYILGVFHGALDIDRHLK